MLCFTAKADVPVIASTTNGISGFALGTYDTIPVGWAVGFTPTENIDVSSVTLWLSGYDAQFVNQKPSQPSDITFGLYENGNLDGFSQPVLALSPQFVPSPNDGSAAPFTFTLSPDESITLDAGQEYWILAYGFVWPASGYPVPLPEWISGGELTGADYDGLDFFYNAGFSPVSNDGTDIPAFTINTVPEPSEYALMGAGMVLFGFRRWRKWQ